MLLYKTGKALEDTRDGTCMAYGQEVNDLAYAHFREKDVQLERGIGTLAVTTQTATGWDVQIDPQAFQPLPASAGWDPKYNTAANSNFVIVAHEMAHIVSGAPNDDKFTELYHFDDVWQNPASWIGGAGRFTWDG